MDIQGKSVPGRRKPQMPRSRGSSRHSILKKPQRSVEQSKQGRGVAAECEGLQATGTAWGGWPGGTYKHLT